MSHTLERCEHEGIKWFPRVTVEKYSPDQSEFAERKLREELSWGRRLLVSRWGLERVPGMGLLVPRIHGDWLRDAFREPEDGFAYSQGNALVAGGLYSMCAYLLLGVAASGANGRAFTNAQTGCGVGTGTTAWAASQTTLVGDTGTASTTSFFQQMDATYPANAGSGVANGGQMNGQVTVASGNGNFNWQEWCWFTASAMTGSPGANAVSLASTTWTNSLMINRWTGTSLGTKGSGATWVFSTTITLS
jgi:hypothetical protein